MDSNTKTQTKAGVAAGVSGVVSAIVMGMASHGAGLNSHVAALPILALAGAIGFYVFRNTSK